MKVSARGVSDFLCWVTGPVYPRQLGLINCVITPLPHPPNTTKARATWGGRGRGGPAALLGFPGAAVDKPDLFLIFPRPLASDCWEERETTPVCPRWRECGGDWREFSCVTYRLFLAPYNYESVYDLELLELFLTWYYKICF